MHLSDRLLERHNKRIVQVFEFVCNQVFDVGNRVGWRGFRCSIFCGFMRCVDGISSSDDIFIEQLQMLDYKLHF